MVAGTQDAGPQHDSQEVPLLYTQPGMRECASDFRIHPNQRITSPFNLSVGNTIKSSQGKQPANSGLKTTAMTVPDEHVVVEPQSQDVNVSSQLSGRRRNTRSATDRDATSKGKSASQNQERPPLREITTGNTQSPCQQKSSSNQKAILSPDKEADGRCTSVSGQRNQDSRSKQEPSPSNPQPQQDLGCNRVDSHNNGTDKQGQDCVVLGTEGQQHNHTPNSGLRSHCRAAEGAAQPAKTREPADSTLRDLTANFNAQEIITNPTKPRRRRGSGSSGMDCDASEVPATQAEPGPSSQAARAARSTRRNNILESGMHKFEGQVHIIIPGRRGFGDTHALLINFWDCVEDERRHDRRKSLSSRSFAPPRGVFLRADVEGNALDSEDICTEAQLMCSVMGNRGRLWDEVARLARPVLSLPAGTPVIKLFQLGLQCWDERQAWLKEQRPKTQMPTKKNTPTTSTSQVSHAATKSGQGSEQRPCSSNAPQQDCDQDPDAHDGPDQHAGQQGRLHDSGATSQGRPPVPKVKKPKSTKPRHRAGGVAMALPGHVHAGSVEVVDLACSSARQDTHMSGHGAGDHTAQSQHAKHTAQQTSNREGRAGEARRLVGSGHAGAGAGAGQPAPSASTFSGASLRPPSFIREKVTDPLELAANAQASSYIASLQSKPPIYPTASHSGGSHNAVNAGQQANTGAAYAATIKPAAASKSRPAQAQARPQASNVTATAPGKLQQVQDAQLATRQAIVEDEDDERTQSMSHGSNSSRKRKHEDCQVHNVGHEGGLEDDNDREQEVSSQRQPDITKRACNGNAVRAQSNQAMAANPAVAVAAAVVGERTVAGSVTITASELQTARLREPPLIDDFSLTEQLRGVCMQQIMYDVGMLLVHVGYKSDVVRKLYADNDVSVMDRIGLLQLYLKYQQLRTAVALQDVQWVSRLLHELLPGL